MLNAVQLAASRNWMSNPTPPFYYTAALHCHAIQLALIQECVGDENMTAAAAGMERRRRRSLPFECLPREEGNPREVSLRTKA